MNAVPKVTSSHVCAALKLRYPKDRHALMFEVAPSTGGGTRYADAVAVGLWRSHGHRIEGIEVKVSRADSLSEMKQPEKSSPVFEFCDRWWLACPKDMVKPDELPSTWGLLELQADGVLREKVKAPKLTPRAVDIGFFAALCRRHAGVDEEMSRVMLQRMETQQHERLRVEYERKFRMQNIEAAGALVDKIKEETGLDLASYENRDLIPVIKLVQSLNSGWDGSTLPGLLQAMRQLSARIADSGLVIPR